MAAEADLPLGVTPRVPAKGGTGDGDFLPGVERDLEVLRRDAVRRQESLRQLREAAPALREALGAGVNPAAIFRVLTAHGYRGTRRQLRYFLEKRLGHKSVSQGAATDGRAAKPRRDVGQKGLGRPGCDGAGRRWGGGTAAATPGGFSGTTVFKPRPAAPESEFERRLAEAIQQRKVSIPTAQAGGF